MSYDIVVFSSKLPTLAGALEPEAAALAVEGEVEPTGGSIALTRRQQTGFDHVCVIDGPLEAEDDDAPRKVAATLLVANWTVQLNYPSDLSKAASKIVNRIARRLADSGDGVVYDPQVDDIVWPRNPKRLRELPRRAERDDRRIELEWLVARRLTSADGHAVLAVLRTIAPEALPRRFGDFEPMQGRLERDGDDAFAEMWNGNSIAFWNGRFPLDHGYVSLQRGWGSALSPEERDARTPELGGRKAIDVDALILEFHAEVIDDERWLSLLSRLFVAVARQLGCFFAGSYCRPDPDGNDVVLRGRYWLGIPDVDLWLVWVGDPYQELLPDRFAHANQSDGGVFLRLGATPVAWAELRDKRIDWPQQILRRGDHLDQDQAALAIPGLTPAT